MNEDIKFPQAACSVNEPHAPHIIAGTWRDQCPGIEPLAVADANGAYTFTVRVRFSDEVLANAESVLFHHGEAAKRAYLERKIDNALEGGYFEHVEATLTNSES